MRHFHWVLAVYVTVFLSVTSASFVLVQRAMTADRQYKVGLEKVTTGVENQRYLSGFVLRVVCPNKRDEYVMLEAISLVCRHGVREDAIGRKAVTVVVKVRSKHNLSVNVRVEGISHAFITEVIADSEDRDDSWRKARFAFARWIEDNRRYLR